MLLGSHGLHLDNNDRFIRWAARTAIEHQPVAQWSDKALGESDPRNKSKRSWRSARCAGVCPQLAPADTKPVTPRCAENFSPHC